MLFSKRIIALTILCLIGTNFANAQGVQASPKAINVKQPDGTSIKVIGQGNMYVHYTETTDGYTLIKNEQGVYEYAVNDTTGNLLAGGIKAKNFKHRPALEVAYVKKIQKHLRYEGKKLEELTKDIKKSGAQ